MIKFSRQRIDQIIKEESRMIANSLRERDELIRKGEINERLLTENGPDQMRVDLSIVEDKVSDVVQDVGMQMADEFVWKFHNNLCQFLAKTMNDHNMSQFKLDPRSFREELEMFDEDGVSELSQECLTEVVTALEKYAQQLGQLAVHAFSDDN